MCKSLPTYSTVSLNLWWEEKSGKKGEREKKKSFVWIKAVCKIGLSITCFWTNLHNVLCEPNGNCICPDGEWDHCEALTRRSAVWNVKRIFIYHSTVPVWPDLAVRLSRTDSSAVNKAATEDSQKRAWTPKSNSCLLLVGTRVGRECKQCHLTLEMLLAMPLLTMPLPLV